MIIIVQASSRGTASVSVAGRGDPVNITSEMLSISVHGLPRQPKGFLAMTKAVV